MIGPASDAFDRIPAEAQPVYLESEVKLVINALDIDTVTRLLDTEADPGTAD